MDRAIQALARMREVCRAPRRAADRAVATAAVREAGERRGVRPTGCGTSWTSRSGSSTPRPRRRSPTARWPTTSPGAGARPGRRHRRRQPRADRRGGWAGGAASRCRSARCGSPSCTSPRAEPRTRRSPRCGTRSGSGSSGGPLAGVDRRPSSSARAAPSPTSVAWCRPAAGCHPSDPVHGDERHDRGGGAAARVARQPDRRAAPHRCPASTPSGRTSSWPAWR